MLQQVEDVPQVLCQGFVVRVGVCQMFFDNRDRFLGAVRDASTGLTLLGARYYDEVLGQFVSVDPLLDTGVPAQFNAYSYAFNNPVTLSDPSGMDPKDHQIEAWAKASKENGRVASRPKLWWEHVIEDGIQQAVDNSRLTEATQNPSPEWEALMAAAGFVRNEDGDYVTPQISWQLLFGYNDIFDHAFDLNLGAGGGDRVLYPIRTDAGHGAMARESVGGRSPEDDDDPARRGRRGARLPCSGRGAGVDRGLCSGCARSVSRRSAERIHGHLPGPRYVRGVLRHVEDQ